MTGLAAVVEHLTDLSGERGDDRAVEEEIETGEDDTTDNDTDDDLHARVDIALTGGGLDGGLGRNDCLVELVLDAVDEILHVFFTSFFLCFFDFGFSLTTAGQFSLTGVVKHALNLGGQSGDDRGVEECVETCEEYAADYDTDDDLDTGIDIALTGGGLDSGSCGDDGGVALVLDGVDKLFHRLITSFFLKFFVLFFVVGKNENGE